MSARSHVVHRLGLTLALGVMLASTARPAHAELVVTPDIDPASLRAALVRAGIHVVGESYSGGMCLAYTYDDTTFYTGTEASGTYTGGPLGIKDGVLMTTGEVTAVVPPNTSIGMTGILDPDVDEANFYEPDDLCQRVIQDDLLVPYDPVRLTIDFTVDPGYQGLQVDYIFGSDEYPEWRASSFNDAFGLFVGPASDPESTYTNFGTDLQGHAININGPFFASSEVIVDPDLTEYDGLTPRLRSAIPLAQDTVYRLVVVICDAGDENLDSGVFLSALAGCSGTCSGTSYCGDGIVQSNEACDDNNNADGDGCSVECLVEPGWACSGSPSSCAHTCGDGVVQANEGCDDQNGVDRDDCTNACRLPTCSDEVLHDLGTGGETDVDCGGTACPGCEIDQRCLLDRDCKSTYCARDTHLCAVPPAPDAVDDAALAAEGLPLQLGKDDLLGNDVAVDPATFTPVTGATAGGGSVAYDAATGILEYTPPAGSSGNDTFTYEACSPIEPTACDTATVYITVNRKPVVGAARTCVGVGTPSVALDVHTVYADADQDALASVVAGPVSGAVVLEAQGVLTLTPTIVANATTYGVSYDACDAGDPSACAAGTWTVLYNDPPVLATFATGSEVHIAPTGSQVVALTTLVKSTGLVAGSNPSDADADAIGPVSVSAVQGGPYAALAATDGALCQVTAQGVKISAGNAVGAGTCWVKVCEECGGPTACAVTSIPFVVATCEADAECGAGNLCRDGACVDCEDTATAPTPDAGCTSAIPVCDLTFGTSAVCVECVVDADCPSGETCDESRRSCVDCLDEKPAGQVDPGCSAATPACDGQGCHPCVVDADCPSGNVCSNYACVACAPTASTSDIDPGCTTATPACDAQGCHRCTVDGHCAPGDVCDPVGKTCVPCRDTASGGALDSGCEVGAAVCAGTSTTGSGGAGSACAPCVATNPVDDVDPGCSSATPDCQGNGAAVTCVLGNVAPSAVDDLATTTEDHAVTLDVVANDTDPDHDAVTVSSVGTASHGTVTLLGNGTVRYTPDADYHGADTFTYTACDGHQLCDTATVAVTVTAVNDAPVAVADDATTDYQVAKVIDVVGNDHDVDGDALTVTGASDPAHGAVTVVGGVVTYTPDAGFRGTDTFTYTVCDPSSACATGTVTVVVGGDNAAPEAKADAAETAYETPVDVAVLDNDTDPDGDALTVTAATEPDHGAVVIGDDGVVTYTPDDGFSGVDTFTVTICDSHDACVSSLVTVTVAAAADRPPEAIDDAVSTPAGTPVTFDPTTNDVDPDGDDLTVTAVSDPEHGTAVVNADGTVTYTPDAGYTGSDTFTVTVSDGHGGTDTSTTTVAVENRAPVAVDDALTVDGDRPTTLDLAANDTDADGDALAVTAVTDPDHGTVALVDGKVVYTPEAGYEGAVTFTYTVSDGHGGSDTATVTLTMGDRDGDGLGDASEVARGTDPDDADSDDDGVSDGAEVEGGTDPKDADSDDDGLQDGTELGVTTPIPGGTHDGVPYAGTDPAKFVPDLDPTTTTDPKDPDTDHGSVKDGVEDANHNGRLDDGESDPLDGSDDLLSDVTGLAAEGGGGCAGGLDPSGLAALGLAALALARRARRA